MFAWLRSQASYKWLQGAVVLTCLGILALHASYFYPFIADDALISLRYSERLAAGKGLNWNDGEYVEGYTNLLWVLANAAWGAIGLDLVLALRMSGAICAALLFLAPLNYLRSLYPAAPHYVLFYALLALAVSSPVAVWTIGGLETMMLAACLAWACCGILVFIQGTQSWRPLWLASSMLSLAVLTRADAPLLVAAAVLGVMVCMPGGVVRRIKAGALLALCPFAAFAAQVAFRLWYYGDFLPNTYYAKFAVTPKRYADGLHYMRQFWETYSPLAWLLASMALVMLASVAGEGRKYAISLLRCFGVFFCMGAGWSCYIVKTGGDIFPAFRQAMPLFVLGAFMLAGILASFRLQWLLARVWMHVLLLGTIAYTGYMNITHPENMRAQSERWEWDCKAIAERMGVMWGGYRPYIAVTAAGCMPFFSKLPAIDMFGLNDAVLAKSRPLGFGYGYLGHELMNAGYVLSRAPEIIAFGFADSPYAYPDFSNAEAFKNNYLLYAFTVPAWQNRQAYVWLSRDFLARISAGR